MVKNSLHYRFYRVKSLNERLILRYNRYYKNQNFKIIENSIIRVCMLVFKYTGIN